MPSCRPLPSALSCVWQAAQQRAAGQGPCGLAGLGARRPLLLSSHVSAGTHASRGLATQAAGSTKTDWRRVVSASALAAGLGGAAWAVSPYFWSHEQVLNLNQKKVAQTSAETLASAPTEASNESTASGPSSNATLLPISDDVFDHQDNLFVFFLSQDEEIVNRREEMDRVIAPLVAQNSLHRLSYFHNVRKEGDPTVPEGGAAEASDGPVQTPLKVVMYKGQRKTIINIGAEVPVQQIVDFYAPVSEGSFENMNKTMKVQRVSTNSFEADVVKASSPDKWILLQMYEDTCFLCFLMRPFINSVAVLLEEHGVPLSIKRLKLEANDFPDSCPVARGTPTFVLFRGAEVAPDKWDEFKPGDLVGKLTKELTKLTMIDESVHTKMNDYQELVSSRFRLFTQMVFWTVEHSKVQALMSAPSETAVAGSKKDGDDEDFNTVVAQMMSRDMKRTDGIHDNMKYLQNEVDEVEHDCAVLGMMLGQSIIEREESA